MDKLVQLIFLAVVFVNIEMAVCQQNVFESNITPWRKTSIQSDKTITSGSKSKGDVHTRNPAFQQYPNKLATGRKVRHAKQKAGRKKVHPNKRAQILEQGKQCIHWIPTLNITAVPAVKNLNVDYCRSDSNIIPNTTTCFISDYSSYCVLIQGPTCSHTFENVSTGNITIWLKASCDVCFESIFYNTECQTPIFETVQFISVDSAALSEPEKSGMTKETSNVRVDLVTGCTAAGFGCVVLTTVAAVMIKKRRVPSLPISDPSASLEMMTVMFSHPTSDPSTSPDTNIMFPLPSSDPSSSPDVNNIHLLSTSDTLTSPDANIMYSLPPSDLPPFSEVKILPRLPTLNPLISPKKRAVCHLPISNPSTSWEMFIMPHLLTCDPPLSPMTKAMRPLPTSNPSTSSEKDVIPDSSTFNASTSAKNTTVCLLPASNPSTFSGMYIMPHLSTFNASMSSKKKTMCPLPISNPSTSSETHNMPHLSKSLPSASPDLKIAMPGPSLRPSHSSEIQALSVSQSPADTGNDRLDTGNDRVDTGNHRVDTIDQQDVNNLEYTLDFYFCAFDKEFQSPPGPKITLNFDVPYTLIHTGSNLLAPCRLDR